ncbi:MAG: MBL fold metallo-hydrolase [bacterium]|nr:MBL fold metallo-hydrolase [bacterium]
MNKTNNLFMKKVVYVTFLILVAGNIFVARGIFAEMRPKNLALYFLDVGQGDGELIDFGDVQILVDGGKDPKVLSELGRVLTPTDRYIDLVIATHPDLDHFGGLIDVLKTYEVGAVITTGRRGVADAYSDFERVIVEKKIPEIKVFAGDEIKFEDAVIKILWPTAIAAQGKKVNESGIVFMLEKDGPPGRAGLRALYTADIGFETEEILARKYDLDAHILKVGHHGSRFSSEADFLKEVSPAVSVIEVGKNSYGHPTPSALGRLASVGSQIFRTDQSGTVKVIFDGDRLKIYD